jgi:two-component system, NarL family, invasion response regulator UvrY
MKPRVLIVDDHSLFREGLAGLLTQSGEYEVVGQAGTGAEALLLAEQHQPQVVVLDVQLPDLNGKEVAQRLLTVTPNVAVVVISFLTDAQFVSELIAAGARAYVAKENAFSHLELAMRAAIAGMAYFSPDVASQIMPLASASAKAGHAAIQPLNEREIRLLTMMAEGHTAEQMAELIGLGKKTVEMHRQKLKKKLGLTNMAEITLYAFRHGYLKPRQLE